MSRFDKFIKKELPKKNDRRNEQKGNVFKRKRKHKRVYKSNISREDFLNKMKNKGATVQSYSIMDAIKHKKKMIKKIDSLKQEKSINEKNKKEFNFMEQDNTSEKDKESLKNFVLSRYYEEEETDDESDAIITHPTIIKDKKHDDIIMF